MTDPSLIDRFATSVAENWPWWFVIFFLLSYEIYALTTGRRTLSRMVWTVAKKFPAFVPISLSIVSWLLLHFYVTHGDWAIELPITGVIIVVIWLIYFAFRKKANQ